MFNFWKDSEDLKLLNFNNKVKLYYYFLTTIKFYNTKKRIN